MAELTTLARPYAKAAFDAANGSNALADWSEALAFAAQVVATKEMRQLLANPALTESGKVEVLADCYEKPVSGGVKNFFILLSENRRLALLPEIAALFAAYRAEQERTINVALTSPFELTGEQQQKLAQALSKKLEREVSLATSLDKSLIGGVVIRAGDTVIDASVRGKLANLADALGS